MERFDAKYHQGGYDPQEWCDHKWTVVQLSEKLYEGHCQNCGLVKTEVLTFAYWAGKDKEDAFIVLAGKKYRALKAWGNIAPCSECGKVFFEVPLILWDMKDPSKAIVFCDSCASRLQALFVKDLLKGKP